MQYTVNLNTMGDETPSSFLFVCRSTPGQTQTGLRPRFIPFITLMLLYYPDRKLAVMC